MNLKILDALDRVAASPHANHCWTALRRAIGPTLPEPLRSHVLQRLADDIPPLALPQFYRAMMLDVLTGDPQWLCVAARLLPGIVPHDADRMTAFFGVACQRSLLNATGLSDYATRLSTIGLPQVARAIDAVVGAALPLPPAARLPGKSEGAIARVAVLAPLLLHPGHPPTRMALDMAEVLISLGYAVRLFSANEAQVPDDDQLLGNGVSIPQSGTDLADWVQAMPDNVAVQSCAHGYSVRRRCHQLLPAMVEFAPDAVVFVGLYSPMATLAAQRWPLLAMATNSVAPMVRAQLRLTAHQHLHLHSGATWDGALEDQLAYYYPYRRHGDPARRAARMRSGKAGIVRLVTAGNVLPARMSGEWVQRMAHLLRDYPHVHWHLLGGAGAIPDGLAGLAPGQIRASAHVKDLSPYWLDSDIYINPPGSGGGMAVAEATDAGLPVVSFADTDGGDKLGDDAVRTMDDYLALCTTLITDPGQRGALGARLAQRFDQYLDLAQARPHLRDALALTVRRFHAAPSPRLHAAAP